MEQLAKALLIGIGGTAVLDIWMVLAARFLRLPPPNWALVGRWIGNMPRGRFAHANMSTVEPVVGEAAIGWGAHYIIGASYGLILAVIYGEPWLMQPSLGPPIFLSWVLLVMPYCLMMPSMGLGLAGSKTPKPTATRLRAFVSHTVFGGGMFATASILSAATQAGLALDI